MTSWPLPACTFAGTGIRLKVEGICIAARDGEKESAITRTCRVRMMYETTSYLGRKGG